MNDDQTPDNEQLETPTDETPTSDVQTETPKSEPPTKDEIREIVEQCFADLGPKEEPVPKFLENPDPLAGYDPRFANDIRRLLQEQAQSIHAEYSPLLTANVANIAVEKVAAECTPKTKEYIRAMVTRMDPQTAKAMVDDPNGLEMLEHIAFGLEARANQVKIPRTSEPGSHYDDESNLEGGGLKAFMNAFGVDRKRAIELYRQAQRNVK